MHAVQVMISLSTYMSCSCLGNVRVHLGNVRALLLYHCSQILLYSYPTDSGETHDVPEPSEQGCRVWSCVTCGSARALLSREAESRAAGRLAIPEPFQVGRQGTEPWDTWQRQSPPVQGDGVRHRGIHDNVWLLTLLPALAWSLYAGTRSVWYR
jgi:hypothetical protein